MRTVVLDLETVTDPPWEGEGFPPLPMHKPIAACWLVVDTKASDELQVNAAFNLFSRPVIKEVNVLIDLADTLKKAHRLVTYNGRCFDMPLLNLRALHHGLDWKWWPARRYRYPRQNQPLWHYDLMDLIGDFGCARGLSLDSVCHAVGLPGKTGGKGEDVQAMWAEGNLDQIVTYCNNDVLLTWALYLKYLLSFDTPVYEDLRFVWGATKDFIADQPSIGFQLPSSMV